MPSIGVDPEARRTRRRLVGATVVVVVAAAYAIAFDPEERRLVLQLAFAALGLLAVTAAVGALRRAAPLAPRSPLDRPRAHRGPAPGGPPPDLARVARRIEAASASAADARRHLAPVVATIAAGRLRDRAHAPDDPENLYAQLPRPVAPELALLLDPALDDVDTRGRPGLDADAVAAVVRALEQL